MAEGDRAARGRVAITGGGGFIGLSLAVRLAAEGHDVLGLDVSPAGLERLREHGIEAREADITDAGAMESALAGAERLFHTAAFVHEWGSMERFVEVNVGGTATVLDAARAAGVERAVHVSSVVVYGYDDPGEQDETAQLRTYGIPYIDTKSASDRLARARGAIVVRPGDVYGPGSVPWTIRPIELALAGKLAVPSRGEGKMLPVYADDLVEALVLASERGEPGRAYTAWEGVPVSFGEYFTQLAELVGGSPPRSLPRPLLEALGAATERLAALRGRAPDFTARSATFIDRRGTVSIERIRTELGWEPRVGLDEGLRRSVEWARGAGMLGEPAPAGVGSSGSLTPVHRTHTR